MVQDPAMRALQLDQIFKIPEGRIPDDEGVAEDPRQITLPDFLA